MKKSKSYFGNRFKSAVRGFRAQRNAKKELAASITAIATSEFETLEPRVLLSGVGKASTSKSWIDADGDKVVAKIVGKGAGIQVDVGDGKFIDAANINIVGADYGALSVVVSPVGKMTTPVQTKTIWNPNFDADGITTVDLGKADNLGQKFQTQWYNLTPGFTNIGSITAEDSKAFGLTAPNAISSINLSAVVVPSIDLGDAAVGNINLSTGQVAMVDDLMNTNDINNPGFDWTAGLGSIDMFNVKAGSIDQINLAGHVTGVNDFVGTIELTTGGLNRLTGTQSDFDGDIYFSGKTGSLGSVFVQNWGGDASINALGDLTFLADDFDGVITVGGHLNVQFRGGFYGVILADGGVSGLRASTTDTIIIQDDFRGQLVSKGDIADIVFEDGGMANGTIEGKNIGTVRFDNGTNYSNSSLIATGEIEGLVLRNGDLALGQGNLLVSAAKVGLLDVANGDIDGQMAAGAIGAVTVRGGDLDATLVATTGDIGDVNVELGSLDGGVIAQVGKIGNVTVLDNAYGNAAISGNIIAGAGSIGTINASNVGGGVAIGYGAVIFAKTDITAINASTTGDTAIGNSTITAEGTLGPVNAIAYGAGGDGAIDGLTLVAPTIGAITATSISGTAIANSNFIATTGAVGSITGTGKSDGMYNVTVNAATSIGNIAGTSTAQGYGIASSTFVALNGTIGTVTGKSASDDTDHDGIYNSLISASGDIGAVTGTAFGGNGMDEVAITSLAGNIGNVTGTSGLIGGTQDGIDDTNITALAGNIGNITGSAAGTGSGINDTNAEALTGIGTISGSSIDGDGIQDSNFLVSGPAANITAVIGKTVTGIAINDSNFTAVGGTIGSITATPTGVGGRAIDGSTFTAATLGDLAVTINNLAGGYAINNSDFVATQGNIGKVTVTNNSLAGGAFGIQNSAFISDKGNIGDVTVSTAGTGSDAIRATYGDVTDFIAAGNIGKVTLTTTGNYSDGIEGHVHFFADNDNSKAGDIGDVSITVNGSGSNGILGFSGGGNFAHFESQNIGNVAVSVTNLGGYSGIVILGGQETVFDIVANMGTFTVTSAGTAPFANGLENVKVDVGGTLGAVTITTVGGVGMFNSSIDPTTIASVTITSDDGDATNGNEIALDGASEILATVSIGNVTITGDVNGTIATQDATPGDKTATTIGTVGITGDFNGTLSAGTTIGAVTISGDATGGIFSGAVAAGNVTSVTAKTVNGLIVGAGSSATNTGTVGAITITGDDGDLVQTLNVNAFATADGKTGGTIGKIEAKGITTDTEVLNIFVGPDALSVGAITVDNAQDKESASLFLSIGAKVATLSTITVDGNAALLNGGVLETIGAVSIGGNVVLGNSFATVKTASTFAANTVGGGQTFGTGAAGSSIGLITINDGGAAANSATFTFASMNGKTNATADATLAVDFLTGAGPDITTLQAKTPGTTVAGITAILV